MLDYQLYGLQPGGHHLTNVLLHAAVAVLLFLVLWRMTGDCWPAAFVAAVFAVHPLRVESVAWVAERKDVLCGLFFMLTLGAYWGYARHPFSRARYRASARAVRLGSDGQADVGVAPAGAPAAGLLAAARMSWQSWRGLVAEKIPLLAMAAVCGGVTILAQDKAIAQRLPLSVRLANASVSCTTYLEQFFCPLGLAAFYPHPENTLPAWKVAVSALVLAGLSVAALAGAAPISLWVRRLVLVFGNARAGDRIGAGRRPGDGRPLHLLAEIGLGIALAWGARQLTQSWPHCQRVRPMAAALAIAILAACAWRQTSYWHDGETLWTRVLDCTTRNASGHYNLGVTLMERGRTDEALKAFSRGPEHSASQRRRP